MMDALALIDDDMIALDEAALSLAALDRGIANDPDRLTPHRTRLAYMSAQLLARGPGVSSNFERAQMLRDLIAREHRIGGDEVCFEEDAGADLIACLDTGRGLPVTLSILYVAIARKVGWRAVALGVPGHVLIRIGDEPGAVFQDPFDDGRILDDRGLKRVLARVLGPNTAPDPAYLAPMDNRATLVRLLTNQAARARRQDDLARALVLSERMTCFAPGMVALWWERARIEQQLGHRAAARASLMAMRETTRDPEQTGRIEAAMRALAH